VASHHALVHGKREHSTVRLNSQTLSLLGEGRGGSGASFENVLEAVS
jgi:hypothetical protein